MDENVQPDLPDVIAHHLAQVRSLCQRFGVARLEVFGSATTEEFDPVRSDIDFLVTYKPDVDLGPWMDEHLALRDALQAVLGRDVDLVFDATRRNPIYDRNVASTRRLVYAAEE